MQSATIKPGAKEVIYPHTQAKLDLYKNYLLNYLRVLYLTPFCSKINLFDIYCGSGIYQDGNIGSPVITNNCIKETNEQISKIGKSIKPVSVIINDSESGKIENVKAILGADKINNCSYEYFHLDADAMLDIVSAKVNSFSTTERNLIFIDPYGYSQIHRDKIYNLLKNEHTEIIMFLPIMQMYRFKEIALSDLERSCYENLRKFIFSFFPHTHEIHSDKVKNVFDFINAIKIALSFNNKFYTCSHYIERGKGNYYALFFITSNMYGLDKMVEAKWKLDPIKGKGFVQRKTSSQTSMFEQQFEEDDNNMHIDVLKTLILNQLKKGRILSNNNIYEISLRNEFKATHATSVLKSLLNNKVIDTCDSKGKHVSHPVSFYMDYTHFKNRENKIYFKNI